MLSQDYTPKVNEYRQVEGSLPGGDKAMGYTLRPPTNRDLITIESIAKESSSNIESQLRIFSLLSWLKYETLLDLDAESVEVMAAALELFPVFRNKAG